MLMPTIHNLEWEEYINIVKDYKYIYLLKSSLLNTWVLNDLYKCYLIKQFPFNYIHGLLGLTLSECQQFI